MSNPRLSKGFGQVSNLAIRSPDLTLREKGLYSYLATFANAYTNELTVGINRMAEECDTDQSTIKRILTSLQNKGYIYRKSNGMSRIKTTVLLK